MNRRSKGVLGQQLDHRAVPIVVVAIQTLPMPTAILDFRARLLRALLVTLMTLLLFPSPATSRRPGRGRAEAAGAAGGGRDAAPRGGGQLGGVAAADRRQLEGVALAAARRLPVHVDDGEGDCRKNRIEIKN